MKFSSLTGKVARARAKVYQCVIAFAEQRVSQREPMSGLVMPEICNYCVEHKIGFVLTYEPGTGYEIQPLPVHEDRTSK